MVVVEEERQREKEKRGRGEERGDQRNVGKERKRVTQIVRRGEKKLEGKRRKRKERELGRKKLLGSTSSSLRVVSW